MQSSSVSIVSSQPTRNMSRAGQKRRRVQEVSDSDEQPDEPQQLHWFSAPAPTPGPAQPITTNNTLQIRPGIYGVKDFLQVQQYDGDATDAQVLETLQNQPPPTYGKVNLFHITPFCCVCNFSSQTQNDYMRDWLPKREEQLATLLAAAAPKCSELICVSCNAPNSKWRCQVCFGHQLLCSRCCESKHKLLPLVELKFQTCPQIPRSFGAWQSKVKGLLLRWRSHRLQCRRNSRC